MVLLATSPPTLACTLKLTVGQASPPHLLHQEVQGWLEPQPPSVEDGEVQEAMVATVATEVMAVTAAAGSEGAVGGEDGASGAGGGARMAITGAAAKVRAKQAVGSSRASSKERVRAIVSSKVRVNSKVRVSSKSHRSKMETATIKIRSVLGQAHPLAHAPSWT